MHCIAIGVLISMGFEIYFLRRDTTLHSVASSGKLENSRAMLAFIHHFLGKKNMIYWNSTRKSGSTGDAFRDISSQVQRKTCELLFYFQ